MSFAHLRLVPHRRAALVGLALCASLTAYAERVTVRPGDSLWGLARRHGTTVASLKATNSLASDKVTAGQVLELSGAKPAAQTSPISQVAPTAATVRVGRGDTLEALARRHGVSVASLKAANGLASDRIVAGQTLQLPGTPVAVAPAVAVAKAAAMPKAVAVSAPPVVAPASTKLVWPLEGQVTSLFGARGSRLHTGLDIAAPTGTPVKAATAGRVVSAGWNPYGFGQLVVVRSGDGREFYYGHNSRLLVKQGAVVAQGQIIAHVGSTGASTGPHLHFEVRVAGKPVNPVAMLPASRVQFARYTRPR